VESKSKITGEVDGKSERIGTFAILPFLWRFKKKPGSLTLAIPFCCHIALKLITDLSGVLVRTFCLVIYSYVLPRVFPKQMLEKLASGIAAYQM